MAFVSEQDRGLFSLNLESAHIGPGAYQVEQLAAIQKQPMQYAPFSSTAPKFQHKTKFHKKKNPIPPGPGSYDVHGQFEKDSGMSTNDTSILSIKTTQSKKPTSSFRSNNNRFSSMETMIPGPGHYSSSTTNSSFTKKSFRKNVAQTPDSNKNNDLLSGFRYINNIRRTTSIPNKVVKINHNEQMAAKDLNQENSVTSHSQSQQNDTQQNNLLNFGKNGQGPEWSKSKVNRFQDKAFNKNVLNAKNLGPGKYNVDRNTQPRYKNNPSSGFASESVRSYCDQIMFNTNSEMKAAIRKETGYKNQEPGPGAYEFNQVSDQNKAIVHQFFGSTCERFKDQQQNKSYETAPGQYYVDKGFGKTQVRDPRVQISFLSTSEKDQTAAKIQKNVNMPGPGQYETTVAKSIKENLVKKYNSGYKGSFGFQQQRFQSTDYQNEVGPGDYSLKPIEEYVKEKQPNSAVFKSKVLRMNNNYVQREVDERNYDQNVGTIQNKIEKQKQYIENLQKIDVAKPAFNSGQSRFQDPTSNRNQSFNIESSGKGLGLAIIDEQKYNQQVRKNRANTTHETSLNPPLQTTKQYGAAFKSEAKRIDFNVPKDGPGPGKYRSSSQWNGRSFNVKYQPLR